MYACTVQARGLTLQHVLLWTTMRTIFSPVWTKPTIYYCRAMLSPFTKIIIMTPLLPLFDRPSNATSTSTTYCSKQRNRRIPCDYPSQTKTPHSNAKNTRARNVGTVKFSQARKCPAYSALIPLLRV
eukprot:TRINITY_DN1688_c0_g1_i1.p1 TRINITY_DN1688_c0_g1~~TRINITY_DN1688_c0_g1_i1.p1  ORF type:complete len:127 (+),score=37.29 TRINITY_DN1688_c0_g1_i1:106-486(+)